MAFEFATNDVVRFTVKGKITNSLCITRWHLGVAVIGAPPAFDSQALLTALRARWRTAVIPLCHVTYSVQEYRLDRIGPRTIGPPSPPPNPKVSATDFVLADPALDTGVGVNDVLPSFNAVSIRLKTGVGGRRWRGSARWPTPGEAATDRNRLTGASLGAYQDAANTVYGVYNSVAPPADRYVFTAGVLSLLDYVTGMGVNPRAAIASFNPLIGTIVNELVGSQNSRKERPAN